MVRLQDVKRRLNRYLDMLGLLGIKDGHGNIYIITTDSKSKGEEDFKIVLKENNISIYKTIRMNNKYGEEALYQAFTEIQSELKDGDIIAIVRGGGDTNDSQFAPYKNKKSCEIIHKLRSKKSVIFITGIGHTSDKFAIDKYVTYSKITPTAAAQCIVNLVHKSSI